MNHRFSTTRRGFLAAAAGGVSYAAFAPSAFADSAIDWKKYAGTTLEVNLIKSPRSETLLKWQKEFEDLTGIKVNAEAVPEQQQRQKTTIELSSGKPSFDVVHISYHVQKRQFEKGAWLADLAPYIADPKLTDPGFWDDFPNAAKRFAFNGNQVGALPLSVDYWIIYYNQELFAQKNISPPITFAELETAAYALTDPAKQTYGFTARGLRNANTPVWTTLMLGYDVDAIDGSGKLQTTSDGAIEAAKLYQRLMTKAAPKGVSGFNWPECQSAFLQGKIGMWLDGVGFAPPLEDPKKSRIAGSVGYALMPTGPKADASGTTGDGIGVTAASQKKEAAYLYCQWAVSKQMGGRLFSSGSGVPFRDSVVSDSDVRSKLTLPSTWAEVITESAKISRLALPVIIPVTEFRDTYGIALNNMIAGADPATELAKATADFTPILEKSEKG